MGRRLFARGGDKPKNLKFRFYARFLSALPSLFAHHKNKERFLRIYINNALVGNIALRGDE